MMAVRWCITHLQRHTKKMKTNTMIIAGALGLIAAAAIALVLSFRAPVGLDTVIGYLAVLSMVGVSALDYRINWKRILGR